MSICHPFLRYDRATYSTQYPIHLFPYHFTSIQPKISEVQLFQNLILKMKSYVKVMGKVKGRDHSWSRIQQMDFLFVSDLYDQPFLTYGK